MKFAPGSTPPPASIVISGIQISTPPTQGGNQVVQARTTNYSTKSSTFHGLNNAIIAADAVFHTLPAYGPGNTQDAWNIFATTYIQTVCGCGLKFANGQACYRMAQLYAQMQHVAPPSSPNAIVGWPRNAPQSFRFFTFPGTGLRTLEVNISPVFFAYWLVVNIGLGMANPIIRIPVTSGTYFEDATVPPFSLFDGRPNGSKIGYCTWDDDQMPMGSGSTDYFNDP